MTFVVVQRGTWPGWPDGVIVELEQSTAAAVLTAARDYQAESGRNLKGDLLALPAGGLRPAAWISDMQYAFDYGPHGRFAKSATLQERAQSAALYSKYNMDRSSSARPATSSTHALGICADVADNGFFAWLKKDKKSERYGLRFTLSGPPYNDDRHMQFFPGTATVALDVTGLDNSITIPEDLMSFKLGFVKDNNGTLFTLFDLVHGRYDQTRDPGVANLWDLLYMPPGVSAQDFGSPAANGSLAILLTGGGFVQQKWPWPPTTANAGQDAASVAAAVDMILKDDFAALAAQVSALDTQSDTYEAELKTIFAKGFMITGTAKP